MNDEQDQCSFIVGMYDRHALVAALNEVLQTWNAEHGCEGCALFALDALGYTAGAIFRQAPDPKSHAVGRQQFMLAIEAGISKLDIGSLN